MRWIWLAFVPLLCTIGLTNAFVNYTEPITIYDEWYLGNFTEHTSGVVYVAAEGMFYTVYDKASTIIAFSIAEQPHGSHSIVEEQTRDSNEIHSKVKGTLESVIRVEGMVDVEAVTFDASPPQALLSVSEERYEVHRILMSDVIARESDDDVLVPATCSIGKPAQASQKNCGIEGLTVDSSTGNIFATNECKPAMLIEATSDCEVIAENEIPLLTRINGLQYDERNDLIWAADSSEGILVLLGKDGVVVDMWLGFLYPFEGVTIDVDHEPPLAYCVRDQRDTHTFLRAYPLPTPDAEHGRWFKFAQSIWREHREEVSEDCKERCPKESTACSEQSCRRSTYHRILLECLKLQPDYPFQEGEMVTPDLPWSLPPTPPPSHQSIPSPRPSPLPPAGVRTHERGSIDSGEAERLVLAAVVALAALGVVGVCVVAITVFVYVRARKSALDTQRTVERELDVIDDEGLISGDMKSAAEA